MLQERMFCNQCEQAAKGQGCTIIGVCGKTPEVAALQDLLIYLLRGLSQLVIEAKRVGIRTEEISIFTCEALFATLTNVNFDPERIIKYIRKTEDLREQLKKQIRLIGGSTHEGDDLINLALEENREGLVAQGKLFGVKSKPIVDEDLHSLQWLLTYGLKGVAAYTYHAYKLGKKDEKVFNFIHQGLVAPLNRSLRAENFVDLAMKCGEINIRAMELLDAGHAENYGHPTPTKVPLGVKKGKAILVSGHDLKDLEEVLKQSAGKGIYVYTHGEMLPAHGYPKLKAYTHFYGHYGTAWQNQQREFAEFPGAILMTTNCLQRPMESYKDNIFTSGPVGWPGIPHIEGRDFSSVVKRALELPGFPVDRVRQYVTVGFGRNAVLSMANRIIDSVKSGRIKKFLLVGGCDGAKHERGYYTELVEKAPRNTIVLTLACGKFRFFDRDLGAIDGIPRLMDVGQCNDAYSAIKIMQALAEAFNTTVNKLPLSIVLSWYEQKAVAILLSLLYLGINNIRLGPSLPAFITPNILKVLVEKFNITPIKTAEEDLQAIMA